MFDIAEIGAATWHRPYWVNLSMDGAVFGFLALLCLGSTVAFALVPALAVSKTDVNDVLKHSGRTAGSSLRTRRWTTALMIGEIALTLVLLAGAGLLARSFWTIYRTHIAIDPSGLTSAGITLPAQQYRTPADRQQFFDRLDARLAADAQFASAAIASVTPYVQTEPNHEIAIDGRHPPAGESLPLVRHVDVGRRYFETLRLRPVLGRTFTAGDSEAGHAGAIVDQRLAALFPDGAIGHRIQLRMRQRSQGPQVPLDSRASAPEWLTIVGVVPTLPNFREDPTPPAGTVYVPLALEPAMDRFVAILARSPASAPGLAAIATAMREDVRALDRDVPVYAIRSMDDVIASLRYTTRVMGSLFGLVALLAIVVTALGLYALTAQGVAQRTHEIGIRVALGAVTSQVIGLFVRRTAVQLTVGLGLGLAGALATGQLLRIWLVQTDARDPLTLALACTFLIIVAGVASAWPARRAARVDPVVALRYE